MVPDNPDARGPVGTIHQKIIISSPSRHFNDSYSWSTVNKCSPTSLVKTHKRGMASDFLRDSKVIIKFVQIIKDKAYFLDISYHTFQSGLPPITVNMIQ